MAYELAPYSEYIKVTNGGAKIGDILTTDYKGYVHNKIIEELSGENTELVLGSNSFLEEFEKGLIDSKTNETINMTIQFPLDYEVYPEKNWISVLIKNIEKQELPKIMDEFIRSIKQECKGVEEFNKYVTECAEELGFSDIDTFIELNGEDYLRREFLEEIVIDYFFDISNIVYLGSK